MGASDIFMDRADLTGAVYAAQQATLANVTAGQAWGRVADLRDRLGQPGLAAQARAESARVRGQ